MSLPVVLVGQPHKMALPVSNTVAQPIISAYQTWSRTLVQYQTYAHIGEGTFGSVFLALDPSGRRVALKRVRLENEREGFPLTALREIKILRALRGHKNIVALLDVINGRGPTNSPDDSLNGVYMVFEYLDHDLNGLRCMPLVPAQIKHYMKQILEGLLFLHRCKIVHRDIKGANILISNQHDVKLADFGLSRSLVDVPPLVTPAPSRSRISRSQAEEDAANAVLAASYTNRVVTLWYRAPELLLGEVRYGPEIDMWSVGCLFAEMFLQEPLFSAQTEFSQIDNLFQLCGTPDESVWPDVKKLPWWDRFRPKVTHPRVLRDKFQFLPPAAFDLLDRLMCYDPLKRLTAEQALLHDFFSKEEPKLVSPELLPSYTESYHENDVRVRKYRAAEATELSQNTGSQSALPTIKHSAGRLKSDAHIDAINSALGSRVLEAVAPPPLVVASVHNAAAERPALMDYSYTLIKALQPQRLPPLPVPVLLTPPLQQSKSDSSTHSSDMSMSQNHSSDMSVSTDSVHAQAPMHHAFTNGYRQPLPAQYYPPHDSNKRRRSDFQQHQQQHYQQQQQHPQYPQQQQQLHDNAGLFRRQHAQIPFPPPPPPWQPAQRR